MRNSGAAELRIVPFGGGGGLLSSAAPSCGRNWCSEKMAYPKFHAFSTKSSPKSDKQTYSRTEREGQFLKTSNMMSKICLVALFASVLGYNGLGEPGKN